VGRRTRLFSWSYGNGGDANRAYDVHPDGDRFVVAGRNSLVAIGGIHIVTNWFEELRERTGDR